MDHQGALNVNFRHYTLKNSELAKNWPSSGPRLSRISNFLQGTNSVAFSMLNFSVVRILTTERLSHGGSGTIVNPIMLHRNDTDCQNNGGCDVNPYAALQTLTDTSNIQHFSGNQPHHPKSRTE